MELFSLSMIFMFLFSGGLKLIYYKHTRTTIIRIDIFPEKIAKAMSIILPVFEVAAAIILLLKENILIYLLILGYLLFFVLLNLKTFLSNETKDCCCYGKLFKSKLGLGGLIHYTYWIVVWLGAMFGKKILLQEEFGLYNAFYIIISLIIVINGLMLRMLIESVE